MPMEGVYASAFDIFTNDDADTKKQTEILDRVKLATSHLISRIRSDIKRPELAWNYRATIPTGAINPNGDDIPQDTNDCIVGSKYLNEKLSERYQSDTRNIKCECEFYAGIFYGDYTVSILSTSLFPQYVIERIMDILKS